MKAAVSRTLITFPSTGSNEGGNPIVAVSFLLVTDISPGEIQSPGFIEPIE